MDQELFQDNGGHHLVTRSLLQAIGQKDIPMHRKTPDSKASSLDLLESTFAARGKPSLVRMTLKGI
jgi:hypothetical protein